MNVPLPQSRSLAGLLLTAAALIASWVTSAAESRTLQAPPLWFEANTGQCAPNVQAVSRGQGCGLFLTADGAVMHLQSKADGTRAAKLHMRVVGGTRQAKVHLTDPLPGRVNYLSGPAKQWRTDVRAWGAAEYRGVLPGVDLVFHGRQGELEYDFRVAPGADSKLIRMSFEGARSVKREDSGDLVLTTEAGDVHMRRPVAWQERDGERREVAAEFVLHGKSTAGFEIGDYDRTLPLVIDPVLAWSRVTGGDGANNGTAIAVDAAGNAYMTGTTSSTDFARLNPLQASRGGFTDAFVMKMDAAGTLVYSTYLGGSNDDIARGIAVDADGNAYITGWTFSTNFPVANALQATRNTSPDAFVAKLNAAGSALVYSTYLGANGDDRAYAIAVDTTGAAYVTGQTFSSLFPTANAYQAVRNGTGDVFVTKLNPAGSALAYSTYLGGAQSFEIGNAIAVDPDGNAVVAGQTVSTDFPVLNAMQPAKGSTTTTTADAFVTKFSAAGVPQFSTYLGGDGGDIAYGVALDTARLIYVAGSTQSFDFPVLNPAQATGGNSTDAFVTALQADGSARIYSTYLGGSADDAALGIAVEKATGRAVVTGNTASPDFPAAHSLQSTGGGGVFLSTDGAANWTWRNAGLTDSLVPAIARDVAFSPVGRSCFAATDAGVFRSLAGDLAWRPVNQTRAAYSVAVDSRSPNIVYAGNFGRVSRSVDLGETWTESAVGLPSEVVNSVVVDPVNPNVIYAAAGTVGGGVYKSTDSGANWSVAGTGLPNLPALEVLIDPAIPAAIYAGVGNFSTGGVYRSTDGGATWSAAATGLPNKGVTALAFDPVNPGTLFAATLTGLYKRTGTGNWTPVLQTGFELVSLAFDPQDSGTIYLGTEAVSGLGILKSADGGATWTAKGLAGSRISALAVDWFDGALTAACGRRAATDDNTDAFVTALESGGTGWRTSTYLGGTGRDEGHGIALDSQGNAWLAGLSYSKDYPAPAAAAARAVRGGAPPGPITGTVGVKNTATATGAKIEGALGTDCPPLRIDYDPGGRLSPGSLTNLGHRVSGGIPPYSFTVDSDTPLPPGLSLTPDGRIWGVPTQEGTWTITVRVADSSTPVPCVGSVTRSLHVRIIETDSLIAVSKELAPDGYDPVAHRVTFTVTVVNRSQVPLYYVKVLDHITYLIEEEGTHFPTASGESPVSATAPPGWTCSTGLIMECTKTTLAPGEVASITVVCRSNRFSLTERGVNSVSVNALIKDGYYTNAETAAGFLVPPVPLVTNVSPGSGIPGTEVRITLTNPGTATLVSFNGRVAPILSQGGGTVVARVPAGATTGPITVHTTTGIAVSPGNFAVRPMPATFAQWRQEFFSPAQQADPVISGPNADPNHNGRSNVMEYATSCDPNGQAICEIQTCEVEDDTCVYRYSCSATATDIECKAESSTDCENWTPVTLPAITISDDGVIEVREIELPLHGQKLFVRMRATLLPGP